MDRDLSKGERILKESVKQFVISSLSVTDIELGHGSYGAVRVAMYQGKECVVKEIFPHVQATYRVQQKSRKITDYFLSEINTLSDLRHPCIVQFLGIHYQEDLPLPLLVMERMHQSLTHFVMESNFSSLLVAHILRDVACGLAYLHSKNVIHRDIKADNILLTSSNEAKISDLGLAKVVQSFMASQNARMTKSPGNQTHMPPEALVDRATYTNKLDIFSFGCVIIYSVVKKVPVPTEGFQLLHDHNRDQPVYQRVDEVTRRKQYLQKMDHASFLRDLAKECLADDPNNRPEATDIADRLKKNIDKMEESDELSENRQLLVQTITKLRQQVNQNSHWRKVSLCLLLLLLLFLILYLFHWISICHRYDGCSSRLEQDCRPLLNLEDATMAMLGSVRDTLYA